MSLTLSSVQLPAGLSGTAAGLPLPVARAATLRPMKLHSAFLSWIGAFVLSVGLACLYGAMPARPPVAREELERVWLPTGITRGLVAFFVVAKVLAGGLEPGWTTVTATDGVPAPLQGSGLAKGWLRRV
jgi:hypothetical protein